MSDLIQELKEEHAALMSILEDIKGLGIGSDEGKERLFSAKAALLSHLGKENQKLYPVLRKAAETDSRLRSMLADFAQDMESVETEAMKLFTKYEQGVNRLEAAREFGKLAYLLGTRIRREEAMLYAEFEKLQARV